MKKKICLALLLPVALLAGGCSLIKKADAPTVSEIPATTTDLDFAATSSQATSTGNTCTVENLATTTKNNKNNNSDLPPISPAEQKKTFTYKDDETGIKLNYPGSCFFNKGVFQCSKFTLSIWPLDAAEKTNAQAIKSFANGQTQLKYVFTHEKKYYALMAWYNGQDQKDLDKVIDKIYSSISFSR
jgi:hypothetical protein